jgi:hypothetical protein
LSSAFPNLTSRLGPARSPSRRTPMRTSSAMRAAAVYQCRAMTATPPQRRSEQSRSPPCRAESCRSTDKYIWPLPTAC